MLLSLLVASLDNEGGHVDDMQAVKDVPRLRMEQLFLVTTDVRS
jgi:hypothetical protein